MREAVRGWTSEPAGNVKSCSGGTGVADGATVGAAVPVGAGVAVGAAAGASVGADVGADVGAGAVVDAAVTTVRAGAGVADGPGVAVGVPAAMQPVRMSSNTRARMITVRTKSFPCFASCYGVHAGAR
jgi:hypothetical protein